MPVDRDIDALIAYAAALRDRCDHLWCALHDDSTPYDPIIVDWPELMGVTGLMPGGKGIATAPGHADCIVVSGNVFNAGEVT